MEEVILFYSFVHDFSVEEFLTRLSEVKKDDEIDKVLIRINSGGGDLDAGWGLVSGFRDFKESFDGDVRVKIDGMAGSWMAYFLLFVENAEAIVQSKFHLHRASVASFIEMTDERMDALKKRNEEIRKAFEARINKDRFEKLAGVSIKRFFDSEQEVIELPLSAKQAKSIGLIKNVLNLNPVEIGALNKNLIAASVEPIEIEKEPETEDIIDDPKTETTMKPSEYKTKYPEEYAELVEASRKKGEEGEQARVKAWMAYQEIDSEAVAKGISEGTEMTVDVMAQFNATALKNGYVAKAKASNADAVVVDDKAVDPKEEGADLSSPEGNEKKEKFDGLVKNKLGLKSPEPEKKKEEKIKA